MLRNAKSSNQNRQSMIRNPQSSIHHPQSAIDNLQSQHAGVYVHIPFCATKCNYCDFSTAPFEEAIARRYLSALLQEIRCAEVEPHLQSIDTVYIGGGTPSIVSGRTVEEILEEVARKFTLVPGSEISLEMNPSRQEAERAGYYRSAGINRLSIGVQSFVDAELIAMTRAHSAREAQEAVYRAVENGFSNVSIDLILGLPGQDENSFRRSIETAAALPIRHLSLYLLELHSGTPLHHSVRSGESGLPSDEFVSRQYLESVEFLEFRGLQQYEVSNFARPGCQSRHNWKYWTRVPCFGFGMSSHSFDGVRRWNNVKSLARYLERVESGESPRENEAEVSPAESLKEEIFLGLRTRQGVCSQLLDDFIREKDRLQKRWPLLMEQRWVERRCDRYALTPAGWLVSNEILSEFM